MGLVTGRWEVELLKPWYYQGGLFPPLNTVNTQLTSEILFSNPCCGVVVIFLGSSKHSGGLVRAIVVNPPKLEPRKLLFQDSDASARKGGIRMTGKYQPIGNGQIPIPGITLLCAE
jgi:hypothetical protein